MKSKLLFYVKIANQNTKYLSIDGHNRYINDNFLYFGILKIN